MPTLVNLTIDAPAADLSFHEPDAVTVSQSVAPDTQVLVTVGHYANTGNVPQQVNFEGLSDISNCSFVTYRWTLPDGSQVQDAPFILAVDTQALLEVWVHTAAEPVGAESIAAAFTVNVSHVQAS